MADLRPRKSMKARCTTEVSRFNQSQVSPLFPALVARPMAQPYRARRSGKGHVLPARQPHPWSVCCQSPCRWTRSALRTDASRFVSGPLSVKPVGKFAASRRDGVGVIIVTPPQCWPRAPVIPRILGTIPPSRTGSSPLQRCTQRSAIDGWAKLLVRTNRVRRTAPEDRDCVVGIKSARFNTQ